MIPRGLHRMSVFPTLKTARKMCNLALAKPIDCSGWQSHGCVWTRNMQVQTKFLWLRKPVAIGDQVDGWRVCWIGGWHTCRVLFVVMVADSDDSAWPSSNERFSDAQNCS